MNIKQIAGIVKGLCVLVALGSLPIKIFGDYTGLENTKLFVKILVGSFIVGVIAGAIANDDDDDKTGNK